MSSLPQDDSPLDFEQSLAQLESLASKLESGDLNLEQSLKAFEQGITLARRAQTALEEAEQKVRVLIERDGELQQGSLEEEENGH